MLDPVKVARIIRDKNVKVTENPNGSIQITWFSPKVEGECTILTSGLTSEEVEQILQDILSPLEKLL